MIIKILMIINKKIILMMLQFNLKIKRLKKEKTKKKEKKIV